ncbi:hypothetical protein L1987_54497 [Smallanthus sonchifolius]|uniref:Uncharacterized protein n=1 Tax=Smallanthus sonchifolius TaxID=185202 RepID=A0ACB9E6X3_9ASTR|nr:hypothetical protein L1987_54497 [Smallanthus sonchifolius]
MYASVVIGNVKSSIVGIEKAIVCSKAYKHATFNVSDDDANDLGILSSVIGSDTFIVKKDPVAEEIIRDGSNGGDGSNKEAPKLVAEEQDLVYVPNWSVCGNGCVGASASIRTKGLGKCKKANIDVVTPEAPLDVAPIGEGVPSLNKALD